MEMKFILPIYYGKDLIGMNWYRNAHYHINNKVKKYYKELIFWEVKTQGLQNANLETVKIYYKIFLKNARTDGGNVRSVVEKFVLDGLTEIAVLQNDTIKCVVGDGAEYYIDKNNPRCEIEILTKTS